jgi:hypothetical protein
MPPRDILITAATVGLATGCSVRQGVVVRE